MATAATVVLLAAATLLLRVPLLAPRLAHWDAVNYALGLHEFNVAAHQPHPPGSPYFILLGRAALAATGDDNAALVLISLIVSVGAVLAEYVLVRLILGRRGALLAAVALMTQPVFWGYGTVATAWTLLAFLATAIGIICLVMSRPGPPGRAQRLVLPSAILMAVTSGSRLDATAFLAPLWFWSISKAEPGKPRRVAALGILTVGILLWLVPTAASGGGLLAWSERLLALLPPPDASAETRMHQFDINTAISFGTLGFTIGPLLLAALVSNPRRAIDWLRDRDSRGPSKAYWALWIVPAFVFLWLVDSTEPGHDLVFTVALVALGTALLVRAAATAVRLLLAAALVVGLQVGVFLFAAPVTNGPFAWPLDSMLLNVTAPGIRQKQSSLDEALQTIRARFDPQDSAVLTLVDQDPYRFMMYYLPEYSVLRLDPKQRTVLPARGLRQGNWTEAGDCLFAGNFVRHAALVLAIPFDPAVVPANATYLSGPEPPGPFLVWDLPTTGPSAKDYLGFGIGDGCATPR